MYVFLVKCKISRGLRILRIAFYFSRKMKDFRIKTGNHLIKWATHFPDLFLGIVIQGKGKIFIRNIYSTPQILFHDKSTIMPIVLTILGLEASFFNNPS